jgi:sodium pump decarboxylase gamma subunit
MNDIAKDLIESLKTGLLGMGIVIAALYFLSLILDLMRLIFYPGEKQPKKNEPAPQETTGSRQPQQEPAETTEKQDEGELVAVIAAALSQYMNVPVTNIKIGSIRQIHRTTPVWGMAARMQIKN